MFKMRWWWRQEANTNLMLFFQREIGEIVTWTSLEWKGGTKLWSLVGHIKEFCLYPKFLIFRNCKCSVQVKRNCLPLGLWFLPSLFIFSWIMSSIQSLKQEHSNFHLLPHSIGHCGQSVLHPIHAAVVYHCCLRPPHSFVTYIIRILLFS